MSEGQRTPAAYGTRQNHHPHQFTPAAARRPAILHATVLLPSVAAPEKIDFFKAVSYIPSYKALYIWRLLIDAID